MTVVLPAPVAIFMREAEEFGVSLLVGRFRDASRICAVALSALRATSVSQMIGLDRLDLTEEGADALKLMRRQ